MQVRIFQHQEREGPGYLAEALSRHGVDMDLVRIDRGEPVPGQLDDVAGLIFMGGPMSVNDPLRWVADELALIRRAAECGLPVLGHCLGGQLIAKALGGRVAPMGYREIGWHPVERLPSPTGEDWLGALPERFDVFHWHGEAIEPPPGAVPLLRSARCEVQAFAMDNLLGLQCHIEMTPIMVREWVELFGAEIVPSPSVQSAADMLDALDARTQALNRVADVLYGRWLRELTGARRFST